MLPRSYRDVCACWRVVYLIPRGLSGGCAAAVALTILLTTGIGVFAGIAGFGR